MVRASVWAFLVFSLFFLLIVLLAGQHFPTLVPIGKVNPLEWRSPLPAPTLYVALLSPVAFALACCVVLRFVPANEHTRLVGYLIVSALGIRYLYWRAIATINWQHPLSITLSLTFLGVEIFWIIQYFLYMYLTAGTEEGAKLGKDSQKVAPSVDVLIPTIDESLLTIRTAILSAKNIAYPNKKIYICDDGNRIEVKLLCGILGVGYFCRSNGEGRKAGNLNNAIAQTESELIAVFDVDAVIFSDFIDKLIPAFESPKVAMVQTPHRFYNPDQHSRNLKSLAEILPSDLEHFMQFVQPARNLSNSVICCGSAYIVRRSVLLAVGGYPTHALVEDNSLSIKLQLAGYQVVFVNQVLSLHEAPRILSDLAAQRQRWAIANFQVYSFPKEMPIFQKNSGRYLLSIKQKLWHLNVILYSLSPLSRLLYLAIPVTCLIVGIAPIVTSARDFVYFAIPFLLVHAASYSWACRDRQNVFYADIFETLLLLPNLGAIFQFVRNPHKPRATIVTPKNSRPAKKLWNLRYSWFSWILLALSAVAIALHLAGYWLSWSGSEVWNYDGKPVALAWTIYNALVLWAAVLASIDIPDRRQSDRYPVQTGCMVKRAKGKSYGISKNISRTGALLHIYGEVPIDLVEVTVVFFPSLCVQVSRIVRINDENPTQIAVEFLEDCPINEAMQGKLVGLLFGKFQQWMNPAIASTLDAVLAILKSILAMVSIRKNNV